MKKILIIFALVIFSTFIFANTTVKILKDNTTSGFQFKKGDVVLVNDTTATTMIAAGQATTRLEFTEIGTASTGVVAAEEGEGELRKTTLTVAEFTQAIAGAALGFGKELYTFQEGVIDIVDVTADVTILAPTETGTPDIGVGSVVASGAIDVLSGTATFEDVMDGFTGTAITSGGSVSNNYVEAEAGVLNGAATANKIFLNFAETWTATEDLTISGTVTIFWRYLGDY